MSADASRRMAKSPPASPAGRPSRRLGLAGQGSSGRGTALLRQRHRVVRRRIDAERACRQARHGKAARGRDHRHQVFEPHRRQAPSRRFHRSSPCGRAARSPPRSRFARARPRAPACTARIDRVDDRLLDTDRQRIAHLRIPRIARVPVPGDDHVMICCSRRDSGPSARHERKFWHASNRLGSRM